KKIEAQLLQPCDLPDLIKFGYEGLNISLNVGGSEEIEGVHVDRYRAAGLEEPKHGLLNVILSERLIESDQPIERSSSRNVSIRIQPSLHRCVSIRVFDQIFIRLRVGFQNIDKILGCLYCGVS